MRHSIHDTAIIHAGTAWPVRGSATATISRIGRITALLDAAGMLLDLAAQPLAAHPGLQGILDTASRLVTALSLLPVRFVGRLGGQTMTPQAAEYLTVQDRGDAVAARRRDPDALLGMVQECERRASRDQFFEKIRAEEGEEAEQRAWDRYMSGRLEDYELLLQHVTGRSRFPADPEDSSQEA